MDYLIICLISVLIALTHLLSFFPLVCVCVASTPRPPVVVVAQLVCPRRSKSLPAPHVSINATFHNLVFPNVVLLQSALLNQDEWMLVSQVKIREGMYNHLYVRVFLDVRQVHLHRL